MQYHEVRVVAELRKQGGPRSCGSRPCAVCPVRTLQDAEPRQEVSAVQLRGEASGGRRSSRFSPRIGWRTSAAPADSARPCDRRRAYE